MYKSCKLILLLFIVFVLVSCNKSPQKPSTDKKGNLPKLPKVLTELEDEILKTMHDLDSITGIEKAIEKENSLKIKNSAGTETAAKQGGGGSGGGQSESGGKEESNQTEETVDMQELIVENEIIIPLLEANEVKGNFADKTTPPQNIDMVWNKINDSITEIHRKWNVLEAQLPLGRTSLGRTEDFEKTLNDLTLSVVNEKIFDSLKLANDLTGITADFRGHFDGIGNHDVYKMYYYIRDCILFAASDNYTKAIEQLNETSKMGDSIRQDLIKNDAEDILKKFELSIEDLENQLTDENFYLSRIKAPIVIKNIRLIQDSFETQK